MAEKILNLASYEDVEELKTTTKEQGDDISSLKNDVSELGYSVGVTQIKNFISSKIVAIGNTPYIIIKNGSIAYSNSENFECVIVDCEEGDEFYITGKGGSGMAKLYAFVPSFPPTATGVNAISVCGSDVSANGLTNETLVAPSKSRYAVFNFSKNEEHSLMHAKSGLVRNVLGSIKSDVANFKAKSIEYDKKIEKYDSIIEELEISKNKAIAILDLDREQKKIEVTNGLFYERSASGWSCIQSDCDGNDIFIVNGKGGSGNYRLYTFTDYISTSANYAYTTSVCESEESTLGKNFDIVVAPKNSKRCIFNFKTEDGIKLYKIKKIFSDIYKKVDDLERKTDKHINKHIKFMVFGNSYGMDSITYVPFILKNLGITSEIYLYRRDACSLRDIYNRWESDEEADTETDGIHSGTYFRALYYIDTRVHSSWQTHARISMKDCAELGGWDFITLQQWSAYSIDDKTYSPWLQLVIDLIRQSVDKQTMLAWTQVSTRASHDDKQASLDTFKNVPYGKYPFDFYIPYGTAIFNARENETLSELGDYTGHNFWKDGVHLQDGLPRYIASLTVCEAICRKFFPNVSVMYDKTRPTDSTISTWGNKMPMTPSIGITEENCLLAQYSAINACNHPFEIIKTESLPIAPERPTN